MRAARRSASAWARGPGAAALLDRALRLLLPWGFDVLGLEVVHWAAVAGNWPSRRAAWRVGFRVEGTLRSRLVVRGERCDAWVGSLLRGEPLAPATAWLRAPVLEAGPGRLRPYRARDVPRIVQACGDPVTRHWLSRLPDPYTPDDARAHLEHQAEQAAEGRALQWAVAAAGDDRLLGEIAVFGNAPSTRTLEVGYWAHPAERGRGAMTVALRLAARHTLLPQDVGGLGRARLVLRRRRREHGVAAGGRARGVPADRCRSGAELLGDGSVDDLVRFDLLADELPAVVDSGGAGHRVQGRGQVAARLDGDGVEAQPVRRERQLGGELGGHLVVARRAGPDRGSAQAARTRSTPPPPRRGRT